MGINGDFFGNLGRMQTGLKKPRLYIHHLFGLMQFTVQYCFHVICMYVPKCRDGRHRQISGRFPMSHVDLGHRSHVETSAHVDLGTIGSGLRTTWAKTPGWHSTAVLGGDVECSRDLTDSSHSLISLTRLTQLWLRVINSERSTSPLLKKHN